jgi:predicted metal-dependent enzyme (double-stranded beta helix superfamily)
VITVLLRYEHHIDHTFLEATHYQDQDGLLTIYRGQEEVARFSAGSWDGVYRYARNRVREPDGGERTAKGLEVELGEVSDGPH